VGLLQVRLYRPFRRNCSTHCPRAQQSPCSTDQEPGSSGEPLFLDVVAALAEAHTRGERAVLPLVTGGRYGLSSKELTPGMVAGCSPNSPASGRGPGSPSASTTTSPA